MTIKPNENILPLILIEGVISDLNVGRGKENLLIQINKRYRKGRVLTGLGSIVGELLDIASTNASQSMYDGEDTENFICLIDEKVVCGTFAGASKLPVGKIVRVVAEKLDGVYVAKGILSESEGFVWITHAWGSQAESIENYKIGWWCFVFQFVCIMLVTIFSGPFSETFFWAMFTVSVVGGGGICLVVALWTGSTMNIFGDPATEVFRILGFAEPERINLNWYQYAITRQEAVMNSTDRQANYRNIHDYKKAIADGKIKMLVPGSAEVDMKHVPKSKIEDPWRGRWGGL